MACGRGVVWATWAVNALCSIVFCGVAMTSFHNVYTVSDNVYNFKAKSALLAACMLGFLIVVFYLIFSFLVLLGRVFADAKFWYGWIVGTSLNTAFYTLLAGLVLNANDQLAKNLKNANLWSSVDYNTYISTFVFAYICAGTYLILFIVLLFNRGAEIAAARASQGDSKPAAATFGYDSKPSSNALAATNSTPAAVAGSTTDGGAGGAPAPTTQWGSSQGAWGHASYGNQV